MTTYIDWDYNLKVATEYERLGDCNGCGQCCLPAMEYAIEYKHDDGSTGPQDRLGSWGERHNSNEDRYFLKLLDAHPTNQEQSPCRALKPNGGWQCRCSVYSKRPKICQEFPMTPKEIEQFHQCGYYFKEINTWKFG